MIVKNQCGFMTLAATDTIQSLAREKKKTYFTKLWLYPANGRDGSYLTANAAEIWVGKDGDGPQITPDAIQPTDAALKIELPVGQKMALEDILVQGTAGDGIFYSYT